MFFNKKTNNYFYNFILGVGFMALFADFAFLYKLEDFNIITIYDSLLIQLRPSNYFVFFMMIVYPFALLNRFYSTKIYKNLVFRFLGILK